MGIEEQPIALIEEIHDEHRIRMWNYFHIYLIQPFQSNDIRHKAKRFKYQKFYHSLFIYYDNEIQDYTEQKCFGLIKNLIKEREWYETYHLFERIIKYGLKYSLEFLEKFIDAINLSFEEWNSPYRIINRQVVPISNKEEISEIKTVSQNAVELHIESVNEHLNQALKHLKPNGDLRNSIKESISMVESVARLIAPKTNTLGKALSKLEKEGIINPLLKESNANLYNYSNGKNGIRHALMEKEDLSLEDARYFLISCSAFTNYLFEKGRKLNLFENQNPT